MRITSVVFGKEGPNALTESSSSEETEEDASLDQDLVFRYLEERKGTPIEYVATVANEIWGGIVGDSHFGVDLR